MYYIASKFNICTRIRHKGRNEGFQSWISLGLHVRSTERHTSGEAKLRLIRLCGVIALPLFPLFLSDLRRCLRWTAPTRSRRRGPKAAVEVGYTTAAQHGAWLVVRSGISSDCLTALPTPIHLADRCPGRVLGQATSLAQSQVPHHHWPRLEVLGATEP